MSNEVVFDTQEEAEAQQALDLQCHFTVFGAEPYKSQTTRWAIPVQRLDGKWAYPVCPCADYTGLTVEVFDPANYPSEE
jgi:hypothetical protein